MMTNALPSPPRSPDISADATTLGMGRRTTFTGPGHFAAPRSVARDVVNIHWRGEYAMKSYGIKAIRNVGLFGHQGGGKTSLAEALLYTTGALDRLGRTDDGTATTDFDPDEQ